MKTKTTDSAPAAILCLTAALGLLCLTLSCTKRDYAVVPVEGKVTVAGKPVANVSVQLQPIGQKDRDTGPGSVGVTDASGHYRA